MRSRAAPSITGDTALRQTRYFGNEPKFWLDLQVRYDLAQLRRAKGPQIEREVEAAD